MPQKGWSFHFYHLVFSSLSHICSFHKMYFEYTAETMERTVLVYLQAEMVSSFVTRFPAQHPGQSTPGSLGEVSTLLTFF